MNIFFEIHKDIPREGPGENESTRRALSMLNNLPQTVNVLDIGCGPGMQTIELAKNLDGNIIALDVHQAFLDDLNKRAKIEGLLEKIKATKGSMFAMEFENDSFDLIWSEGAIFIIGFQKGLREWKPFIKKDGYLVVSELSWINDDAPLEIIKFWEKEYPDIKSIEENIEIINGEGYKVIDTFILPESGWWDNYYDPIEKRIAMLREKYKDDLEINAKLDNTQQEINMYRKYSKYYGYVFYIAQK